MSIYFAQIVGAGNWAVDYSRYRLQMVALLTFGYGMYGTGWHSLSLVSNQSTGKTSPSSFK